MPLISDNFHNKKLKDMGINIKTKYIVGTKILEKNSDDLINDDIESGIICEKDYFVNKELKHIEKEFDSRIEYSFVAKKEENKNYTCPNCGMKSKLKDFIDGCPYCKTYYNIDYSDKELGNKYHYDRVVKSNLYRIITAVVDIIICIVLSYFYIKNTSRTFNSYDIAKIFIYGSILALILYYFFYIIDGYVVLLPIKIYKDWQNQKQKKFWEESGIDKKKFFNNFNYELGKYYYNKDSNIIDYDILDYLSFKKYNKDKVDYVEVVIDSRIVMFSDGKFKIKYKKESFVMKKNMYGTLVLDEGANIIKCYNCGASIDVNKGYCEYCHSEIKYLQEWILVE